MTEFGWRLAFLLVLVVMATALVSIASSLLDIEAIMR